MCSGRGGGSRPVEVCQSAGGRRGGNMSPGAPEIWEDGWGSSQSLVSVEMALL